MFPIVVLIVASVFALVYVGGILDGASFVDAFANTDATVGLPWGGLVALVVVMIYFIARRLITFKQAMACIPKGFNAMVPAITILTLATSLKNMTGLLGADVSKVATMEFSIGISNDADVNTITSAVNRVINELSSSGDPFWVRYVLKEPIETPLDADTLAAYAALHTYKPSTTVTNDAGAGQKVAYVADTKTYIDQKFTQLQSAIIAAIGTI